MRSIVLRVAAVAVGVVLLATLMGCANAFKVKDNTTLQIFINWPIRGRLIPLAANAITVTVSDTSGWTATQTAVRPTDSNGGTSDLVFDTVPIDILTMTSTAYPNSDGTGTALATGTIHVVMTTYADEGVPAEVWIDMGTTIMQVVVSGMPASLSVGQSVTLIATPEDASGAAVLVEPGDITWASADPTIAGVDATGVVTGVKTGSTTITAVDSETGVKGTAKVTVQ